MLHIIYGADSFARREALAEFRASLDEDGALATNTMTLRAADSSAAEVIAVCSTPPFLGNSRLVVLEGALKQAQGGAKQGRRTKAEGEAPHLPIWAGLVDFAGSMPETTVLVLLDGDVGSKNTLLESLRPLSTVHACVPPGPKELAGWAQARARRLGIKLDGRAAQRLTQLVGGQERAPGDEFVDTWSLATELDKLAAYANGEVIREEHVLSLSPNLRDQKSYFLCDAIIEQRPAAAAKIMAELLDQHEPSQKVLSTIAGRFRRLAIARDMLDAGESGEAIRKELDARPGYGFDKLLEQAHSYSPEDFRTAYGMIVESEVAHKSGLAEEEVALQVLVQELASLRMPAGRRPA